MANKLWIKAKICEILMGQASIHYADLMKEFDPSCQKDVIEVLAKMYHEKHIWSTLGVVKWDTRNSPLTTGSVKFLCDMIAGRAGYSLPSGRAWCRDDISELSQNSFDE